MRGVLIDSNVLLDVFTDDPIWSEWSVKILDKHAKTTSLYINCIIYAEVSIGFEKIEELERALQFGGLKILDIPKEALFLAGKMFLKYHRGGGKKRTPLPDFFIGAQAAVFGMKLITRDERIYRTYLRNIELVTPHTS